MNNEIAQHSPDWGNESSMTNVRFVTVAKAAQILDTTELALRAKIKRREIPSSVLKRFGKRALRVDVTELIAWARSTPAY
jgi:hypothetical protein